MDKAGGMYGNGFYEKPNGPSESDLVVGDCNVGFSVCEHMEFLESEYEDR